MEALASWPIPHPSGPRRIDLILGNLTQIPARHHLDILVVSAFAGDYLPTPNSLIGALARTGISVDQLARMKEVDLRDEFSCWLSHPIEAQGFSRILCIESGWRGTPLEITDDLFRAIAAICLSGGPTAKVAMPIIGAGNQQMSTVVMLESILRAAVSWIERGLQIEVLQIFVHAPKDEEPAKRLFLKLKQHADTVAGDKALPVPPTPPQSKHSLRSLFASLVPDVLLFAVASSLAVGKIAPAASPPPPPEPKGYDVFMSYSHLDAAHAQELVAKLKQSIPTIRIFYDRKTLSPGQSWLMTIAESLDNSRLVVALFTPNYWSSTYCKDEFTAALTRQIDTSQTVIFPIYLRTANIPYMFRNLQCADCREDDTQKLAEAGTTLQEALKQA